MRRLGSGVLVAAALLFLVPFSARAVHPFERIRQATVGVGPSRCAGVIVEDSLHAITAAHCVRAGETLPLLLHDGSRIRAAVVEVDPGRDLAILQLEQPAPVSPLEVAEELPAVGEELFFSGRLDRSAVQLARVERRGRCPSLPSVPEALFTTIDGSPGDSGAPLVNRRLRVVGLVHGGAACHIAAPTNQLRPMLAKLGASQSGVGGAGTAP